MKVHPTTTEDCNKENSSKKRKQERRRQRERRQRRQQKHKVHFSKYDVIFDIPHMSDWSQAEVDSVWYTTDELDDILTDTEKIEHLLEQGHTIPSDECCHGLDADNESINRRLDAADEGRVAVLQTQEELWEKRIHDPDHIADIYFDTTSINAWEAKYRAIRLVEDIISETAF